MVEERGRGERRVERDASGREWSRGARWSLVERMQLYTAIDQHVHAVKPLKGDLELRTCVYACLIRAVPTVPAT